MTTENATLVPAAPATPAAAPSTPAPELNVTPGQPAAPVAEPAPLSIDAPPEETLEVAGVTYEPTGDPVLDLALDFVGRMGFKPEHPAMQAASEGKFDLLKAEMKKLGDKANGWEKFVAAGEAAYKNGLSAKETAAAKTREAVMSVMGDEPTWTAVQAWAAANADPAEKVAVNAGLAAGGVQAKAMALYLKQCFDNAGGKSAGVERGASPVRSQTNAAPGSSALSPRAYVQEVQALRAKLVGRDVESSAEYQALQSRRMAWRG